MAEMTFGASFLKIERAKTHIQELERLIAAYLASEPVQISTGAEGRAVFMVVHKCAPVPVEAGIIAGDIFHNLRSALDLMACELCGPPGQPDPDVRFPFCGEASELDVMIKRRYFDRAGDAAVKLLKEWAPHKGGNMALRAIHDLNIRDKHKMLIIHPMQFAFPVLDTQAPSGAIEIVGDPSKPSDISLSFPADCALAGQDLIPTLHSLVDLTARVVESFKMLGRPAG